MVYLDICMYMKNFEDYSLKLKQNKTKLKDIEPKYLIK